jgi:competence protein ComEA
MLGFARRMSLVPLLGLVLVALAAPAVPAAPVPPPPPPKKEVPAQPIDINAAGEQELVALPGIGEATARLIVEWRKEHGPFRRVEDLMKVKGIGEKSFEKLRPYVKVVQEK